MNKSLFAFLVLLLLLLPNTPPTTVRNNVRNDSRNPEIQASLDLESKATDIVIGQVESTEARWNETENVIYTYSRISVEDYLKGDHASEEIAIRYRGGEVGNIGLRDSTAPQFKNGKRVKLLLTQIIGTNLFAVVGGKQGEMSLSQPASAGYSYDGYHWAQSALPVQYYINQIGTPDIPGTADEFSAVQKSFQTWEDDAGSYMDYTFAGTTTRGGSSQDGFNVVSWQHIDGPRGTLAETFYWYDVGDKLLTEFDMVFDEDETWSVSGDAGRVDVQNIGTHEVGHTLVLNDLYDFADSEETMYGYGYTGEIKKRDLYTGDIAGLRFIYGLSTITYTVDTHPQGLQVEVDGTPYEAPYSFSWYSGTQHFVNAVSPQLPTPGKRHLFDKWSDGGTQLHSITVGTSDATLTANYVTQYQVSFTFETDDNLQQILPTEIKLLGGSPNNTLTTLKNYVDVWLNEAQWTITEILWRGNNVVSQDHPTASLSSNFEWKVETRIYPTRFDHSFKDNEGLTLPASPSGFQLTFPNGTLSGALNPSELYYIQNGTTNWNSITWQNAEVAPNNASFDASNGNPSVNCLIYSFTIRVTDPLGLPVLGASVSITTSDGVTAESLTQTDGDAVFEMIPQGKFTARVSYIGQTTTMKGDVAETAKNPAETQIIFSPPVMTLLLVPAFITCVFALIILRRRRTVKVPASSPQSVSSLRLFAKISEHRVVRKWCS